VPIETTLQEALLELRAGDTTAAATRLTEALSAMPTLGLDLLSRMPQAGSLVRAMMLRARLAARAGDAAAARTWAAGAATLWGAADPGLRADLEEMRRLAAGPS
jgi:Tfp pilus assembly protein PilF